MKLAAAGLTGYAQEHSYAHYDVRDGLAGATVYSMVQDQDGFMWFATETGLSRFDGTHFVNFTAKDGLPDNEILKLYVDHKNRVWFIPFKNSLGYYYKGKIFTKGNDSLLRSLNVKEEVESIVEDKSGNILFKEASEIQILHVDGHIESINIRQITGLNFIHAGLNPEKEFRVCTVNRKSGSVDNKIVFFDIVNRNQFKYVRETKSSLNNNTQTNYISPDLETTREDDQIVFTNPGDGSAFSIPAPRGFVSLSRINDTSVMLNSYASSFLVSLPQRKIVDSFLSGQQVNNAFLDAEGNIWFCTADNGIYRLSSSSVNEYYFKYNKSNLAIFSIFREDSILWLGGDHFNLYRLNFHTHRIVPFKVVDGAQSRGRVMGIAKGMGERLIVGTDLGVYEFSETDHKVKLLFPQISVKSFQARADSQIIVASNLTVIQFRIDDTSHYRDVIEHRRTTSAYMTNDSTFYIGKLEGLFRTRFKQPFKFLGDRWPLFKNRIVHIVSADDKTLWIGTNGAGIIGFRNDSIITHLTEADGLTSNICRSLILANGSIWVGTDKGLNKVTVKGDKYFVTSFTVFDGLGSDLINAIYVDSNNIVVATPEGLTAFDEDNISRRSICLLRMTGITVSDKLVPMDGRDLFLDHKDNNIKFDFTGISFRSAGNILYQYRLIGLDTTWQTTKIGSLNYPSLPSGTYELQVIATNKFGVQSNILKIPFTVDKLLWERIWFRLLLIALIAGAIILYFNYRLRKVQQKEAEKTSIATKMAELEQMALRSQMNPHFIFNCLNSIQQYVIFKDVLGANEFITKFSYLIRQTLDLSAKPSISLNEEIDYIDTYMALEKKRFDDKFIYEIVVDREVDRTECHIPPMILQPYIENSIRHGIGLRKDNDGRLWIRMQYQEGFLVCIVEDNGVGREMASLYKSSNAISYQSVGMSLVSKRIEMLNRTSRVPVRIEIEDLKAAGGAPLGTKIILYFPFEIVLA